MPISVTCANTTPPILYCEFPIRWTWGDFEDAVQMGCMLLDAARGTTLVVNAGRSAPLPVGQAVPQVIGALDRLLARAGEIIIIAHPGWANDGVKLAARVLASADRVFIVGSKAEAREYLRAWRWLCREQGRLIGALRSESAAVVMGALQQLRLREWLYDGTLRGLALPSVRLNGANLLMADLREADLQMAELRDANLMMAGLVDARLTGADLRGATLAGADLTRADLRFADLAGANLHGARLRAARLDHARFDHNTLLPDGGGWAVTRDLDHFLTPARPDSWYATLRKEAETHPLRPLNPDLLLESR